MSSAPSADDVDLRVYGRRLLDRWWVVAAAVLVAVGIGIGTNASGSTEYEGKAFLNLGVPLTSTSQVVAGAYTNSPLFAQTVTRQAEVLAKAAAAAGLPADALAGHVSIVQVASTSKNPVSAQVELIVRGPWSGGKAGLAAQSLAEQVVAQANVYPETKVKRLANTQARLQSQITEQQATLKSVRVALETLQADRQVSAIERAVIQNGYLAEITQSTSLLIQLQNSIDDLNVQTEQIQSVEEASIITPARAARASATSHLAALVIAIALGLVVGVLLALVSFAARPARPGA